MTVVVYRDSQGEWRWRVRADNGEIVADSAEGYRNRADCLEMAGRLFAAAAFPIDEETE